MKRTDEINEAVMGLAKDGDELIYEAAKLMLKQRKVIEKLLVRSRDLEDQIQEARKIADDAEKHLYRCVRRQGTSKAIQVGDVVVVVKNTIPGGKTWDVVPLLEEPNE